MPEVLDPRKGQQSPVFESQWQPRGPDLTSQSQDGNEVLSQRTSLREGPQKTHY